MHALPRAAAVAALALTLSAPALGAAHASGNHWKTLATTSGGKIQACKVATTDTGPWKVKLRVDARQATTAVSGTAFVTKNEKNTDQHWKSGFIGKGKVSDTGVVKLARGKAFALGAGIGTHNMGNGGSFRAGQIPHC
jgi:hypothetical protein